MLEIPPALKKIWDQGGHWGFKITQLMAKKRVRILTFVFLTALTAWLVNSRLGITEDSGPSVLSGVLDKPPQLKAAELNGIIVEGINRAKSTVPRFDQFNSLFLIPEPESTEASGGV